MDGVTIEDGAVTRVTRPPVPEEPTFAQALDWHRWGQVTAPDAMSVRYCTAMLQELDAALHLLNTPPQHFLLSPAIEFLDRHREFPYG
jgi:hypothetical protein